MASTVLGPLDPAVGLDVGWLNGFHSDPVYLQGVEEPARGEGIAAAGPGAGTGLSHVDAEALVPRVSRRRRPTVLRPSEQSVRCSGQRAAPHHHVLRIPAMPSVIPPALVGDEPSNIDRLD